MTFDDLVIDAIEILDLRPDGWTRSKSFDMLKLAEETEEVAECFTKSQKTLEDLGEELSDVVLVCAAIAIRSNIDLEEACRKKQVKRVKKLVDRFHNGTYPSRLAEG